jgi:hypothetical protein
VPLISGWIDAHQRRTGEWPTAQSGPVAGGYLGDNWRRIDNALKLGLRGLPGGDSLAKLLVAARGVLVKHYAPDLTAEQILAWADRHHAATGTWPNAESGPVPTEPGEDWQSVNMALWQGFFGLPGGSSLARLIAEGRGVRNLAAIPPLTIEQILAWADAHHYASGQWPKRDAGPVASADGESWGALDDALRLGLRGLPGGSSLAQLLAAERGVRNKAALPRLTLKQIRAWAKAHRGRTGAWPGDTSGPIPEAPGETWKAVQMALVKGLRGLKGGSSLARLPGRGRRGPERETG